jgi:hypothetical protein
MLLRVKLISGHEEVVQFNRIGRFSIFLKGEEVESDLEYLIGFGFGQRARFKKFEKNIKIKAKDGSENNIKEVYHTLNGFTGRCNNIIKHIPIDAIFSIYSVETGRAFSVADLMN